MTVTIMLPTRDRVEELERTCAKLKELWPPADEIIIFADGCGDTTTAMMRSRFPGFRLLEAKLPSGSVFARDQMVRAARGDIVVSLDDDSYPMERDFIARVERVFEAHPEAAVLAFAELRQGNANATSEIASPSSGRYVPAYANCAAAMRRSVYLVQPGFPVFFGHMYEEPDYALQCYASGKAVWFEPSIVVRHHESAMNRDLIRRHHLNARNELWSVWMRCPWPWLLLVSIYRIARQFIYVIGQGPKWTLHEPVWWVSALRGLRRCWRSRRPVPWSVYRQWLGLARRRIHSAQQLQALFPTAGREFDSIKSKPGCDRLDYPSEVRGSSTRVYRGNRGIDYPEGPLAPTLSPSEGVKEKHRQIGV